MGNVYKMFKDAAIQPAVQQKLNQPLTQEALEKEHVNFLQTLVHKLESGQLNPLLPKSLYNLSVYNKLSEENQEKADLAAVNMMGIIRQIEKLWELDHKTSFQIQNLVETVWQMKSKFEEQYGDVYII